MRAGSTVLLLLLVAGCAGPPSPLDAVDPSERSIGTVAEFGEDTGGLQGVVTDDALVPLEGVHVVFDGRLTTATDAQGAFVFSRLAPGTFPLALGREGFVDSFLEVTIVAGELTSANQVLQSTAQSLAYHSTYIQRGFIACAVSARAAAAAPFFSVCRDAGIAALGEDRSRLHWSSVQVADNLTGLWIETVWQSSQALSANLMVGLIATDTPEVADSGIYVQGLWQGPSPLRRAATGERVAVPNADNPSALRPCFDGECGLLTEHQSPTRPQGAGEVGVALVLQQGFEEYLTAFHHEPLPEAFSALPDA